MYTHDVRWYALIPVAILIAMIQLAAETTGLYFSFPARPDWLWAIAFHTSLRTPPTPAILAFAACGLVRDLTLGPKPGSAAIAFILVGWMVLYWRLIASERNMAYQALLAGMTAFLVALLKHSLDYGSLTYKLIDRVFFISAGDAALTFAVYLPLILILGFDSFRPWKERSGSYM